MSSALIEEQVDLYMQGTEYGDEDLKEKMAQELRERLMEAEREGRPLRVYAGYDPRTPDLHLGHTVTMRKLRQFQDYGHEVTFLIGDYTALIGDPSDKDVLRPRLSPEEVEDHARTYAEQAFRILDPKKTIIRHNSEWLSKLSFADLIDLASNFTLQQFLTRETFRKRFEHDDPIYLHETFYPIMQGYDAYALRADVQVGGSEQLFSIVMAGRKIMSSYGVKPNIAILMPILVGTDGVVRMSKSLGNHIPLNSTPEDMYGKVMSLPDTVMPSYFRLVTRWGPSRIQEVEAALREGKLHPRDAKMMLAHEIVSSLFGEEPAEQAEAAFVRLFQRGEIPEEMPELVIAPGTAVLDVLIQGDLVSSRSEGRRLIEQKGVRLEGEVLEDGLAPLLHGGVLQVGKRKYVKVILSSPETQ